MKPNILIAVPAYRDHVHARAMLCYSKLIAWLVQNGIAYTERVGDVNGIDTARNFFASVLYYAKDSTHLLMLDDDMLYSTTTIPRMLEAQKSIMGLVYPKKGIDLAKPIRRELPDFPNGSEWCVADNEPRFDFRRPDELQRVFAVGAGVMLIERQVIDKLAATGKLREQHLSSLLNVDLPGPQYGFFDRVLSGGHLAPEDYSFCMKWSAFCNGEVHAIFDPTVGHIGSMVYRATY